MMSILHRLRATVDRYPYVATVFRSWRDRRALASLKLQETPHGFSLYGGNYIAAGYQEWHELELISDLLATCDILIDVGANSGLFSCLAAAKGKSAIALEPHPDNVQILIKNLQYNGFESIVEVLPIAVSDVVAVLPLFGSGQGASLVKGWGGVPARSPHFVPTNTIDNLFADRLKPLKAVFKVDVEGAELRVLKGASSAMQAGCPFMVEMLYETNHPDGVNSDFAKIIELFWNYGYTCRLSDQLSTMVNPAILASWIRDGTRTGVSVANMVFTRESI